MGSDRDFTEEQLEICNRIKSCQDYYEVLSVNKGTTVIEIKRAYRKLALQLHPDKNYAPGAIEAFKSIANAADVLTDPDKRKQYDLFGSDGSRLSHNTCNTPNHHQHVYRDYSNYGADLSEEEIFVHMFFGNDASSQRTNPTSRRHQHHGGPVMIDHSTNNRFYTTRMI